MAQDQLALEAIRVMEAHTGVVKGYRRAHARGLVFRGTFTASAEARALTTAEHFQGESVPVEARLSNSSGSPYAPDFVSKKVGAVVGLGVRFTLPSGARATWAAANIPAFLARKPQDFIDLVVALRPSGSNGKPSPLRALAYVVTHPSVFKVLKAITSIKPTPSLACVQFNSVHAYHLVNAPGDRSTVRYRWVPVAGTAVLDEAEAAKRPAHYLLDEAAERVAKAPVAWDLVFQLAAAGDPIDDAMSAWPDSRPTVVAGRLLLNELHPDQDEAEKIVFDPTGIVPGIELSADPILHFRARVYTESKARRAQEQRPEPSPPDMRQSETAADAKAKADEAARPHLSNGAL